VGGIVAGVGGEATAVVVLEVQSYCSGGSWRWGAQWKIKHKNCNFTSFMEV